MDSNHQFAGPYRLFVSGGRVFLEHSSHPKIQTKWEITRLRGSRTPFDHLLAELGQVHQIQKDLRRRETDDSLEISVRIHHGKEKRLWEKADGKTHVYLAIHSIYIYIIIYKQNLEFFKTNNHSGHAHIPRNNLELFGAYVLYIKCHVRVFLLPCSALQRILLPMWPRWQLPWTWTLDLTQFHTF